MNSIGHRFDPQNGTADGASDTIIRLRDVSRSYRLGNTVVEALSGVNLEIGRGELTAVAGPSGSGKTTLLNIVGCIDKPDLGRVEIAGRDVTNTPTHRLAPLRNRYLGYVFQTFNLIPVLTAFENVEYPLQLAGAGRADRRERVELLLERVGLADHGRHRPRELSGGQRQRVAIARALVTEPLAVLADEPTANLDSRTGAEVLDLLDELNQDRGVTFVFSTHDRQIISRARRVVRLTDGAIASDTLTAPSEPRRLEAYQRELAMETEGAIT